MPPVNCATCCSSTFVKSNTHVCGDRYPGVAVTDGFRCPSWQPLRLADGSYFGAPKREKVRVESCP